MLFAVLTIGLGLGPISEAAGHGRKGTCGCCQKLIDNMF